MVTYHNKIGFDGAWIDMSEAASFCVGSCGTGNVSLYQEGESIPMNKISHCFR